MVVCNIRIDVAVYDRTAIHRKHTACVHTCTLQLIRRGHEACSTRDVATLDFRVCQIQRTVCLVVRVFRTTVVHRQLYTFVDNEHASATRHLDTASVQVNRVLTGRNYDRACCLYIVEKRQRATIYPCFECLGESSVICRRAVCRYASYRAQPLRIKRHVPAHCFGVETPCLAGVFSLCVSCCLIPASKAESILRRHCWLACLVSREDCLSCDFASTKGLILDFTRLLARCVFLLVPKPQLVAYAQYLIAIVVVTDKLLNRRVINICAFACKLTSLHTIISAYVQIYMDVTCSTG